MNTQRTAGSDNVATGVHVVPTPQSITLTLLVDQSPEIVFAAISNVRGWWSEEIDGGTEKLGDEFTYRYKEIHSSRQRITESVPGRRVVWRVLDCFLNFKDVTEWTGTEMVFEIARKGDQTELHFTHVGLTPQKECFEACTKGWGFYVMTSLRNLIATGKGEPSKKAAPR